MPRKAVEMLGHRIGESGRPIVPAPLSGRAGVIAINRDSTTHRLNAALPASRADARILRKPVAFAACVANGFSIDRGTEPSAA